MVNTGLEGPFRLTKVDIDSVVTKISPGVYALGWINAQGAFVVCYVGRSDDDLNARLHCWVGEKNYTHFKASYLPTPKAAFEKECSIYHDFGGREGKLDNDIHPDRPKWEFWTCLSCYTFR